MASRVALLGDLVTPLKIFCTVLRGIPEAEEISSEVMPSVRFHFFISSIVIFPTPFGMKISTCAIELYNNG
jgi:hypothetical protein